MPKRHPKHQVLQTNPADRRVFIFTQHSPNAAFVFIIGLILLGIGWFFFSLGAPLLALFPLLAALDVLWESVTRIDSLSVQGNKLMVEYPWKLDVYNASEIKIIDWEVGSYTYWGHRRGWETGLSKRQKLDGDLGATGLYTPFGGQDMAHWYLTIETDDGKKLQVMGSPHSSFDMKKPLVEWQEKYRSPSGGAAAAVID